jgi:uncharacterized hydrophobic protein (TIGR00271 family)
MLHMRIVVPARLSAETVDFLLAEPGTTNVVVLSGAARSPAGDLVLCDVTRESGQAVLDRLSGLGIEERGSIAVDEVSFTMSRAAEAAERAAPGAPANALVWEQVQATANEEAELSGSFLTFLCIATLIAGIGVLLDQPILVVGAMVVGPEFGAVAGLCVAAVRRQGRLALRSARALLVGFPVAMVLTVLATLLGRATGLVSPSDLDRSHPLTAFISQPDIFSFIVALLAGAAGILSLTTAKSGALIGVLISVTTVPAAGNVGVAVALGDLDPALGSLGQLSVNLAGMLVAGILTLLAQERLLRRESPVSGRRRPGPSNGAR